MFGGERHEGKNPNLGDSVVASHHVAEVASVPLSLGVLLAAVLALVEVEVGTGGGAAVGGVAELVDVEAVLSWLQVANVAGYLHRSGSLLIREIF